MQSTGQSLKLGYITFTFIKIIYLQIVEPPLVRLHVTYTKFPKRTSQRDAHACSNQRFTPPPQ